MSSSTRNLLIVAIVFVGALGSVLRLNSAEKAPVPDVQKWEHTWTQQVSKINELGDQGWEMTAVVALEGSTQREYYFKRPKK